MKAAVKETALRCAVVLTILRPSHCDPPALMFPEPRASRAFCAQKSLIHLAIMKRTDSLVRGLAGRRSSARPAPLGSTSTSRTTFCSTRYSSSRATSAATERVSGSNHCPASSFMLTTVCAGLEDYFDPNDNWFQAMRDKVQDAVGPLHESLEAAKERAQSSAETVELLKRELSVKAGDLAERTARVQELEGRDGVKDAVITSKGACHRLSATEPSKLIVRVDRRRKAGRPWVRFLTVDAVFLSCCANLTSSLLCSSLAQSSRLQAVMLESQVEQLKETCVRSLSRLRGVALMCSFAPSSQRLCRASRSRTHRRRLHALPRDSFTCREGGRQPPASARERWTER